MFALGISTFVLFYTSSESKAPFSSFARIVFGPHTVGPRWHGRGFCFGHFHLDFAEVAYLTNTTTATLGGMNVRTGTCQ